MPDFADLRTKLAAAREQAAAAALTARAAADYAARIAARQAELARGFAARNASDVAAKSQLDAEAAAAQAKLRTASAASAAAVAAEASAVADFAAFTDPRRGISQWNDATPVLLMPVRLETRFKGAELWLRIYPDECSIDTFDPVLTDTEVASAKAYWLASWQAGGIDAQERAGWNTLALRHGAGRAAYIVAQFVPGNRSDKPVKARAEDVILAIGLDASPDPAVAPATLAYWQAAFLAGDDAAAAQAARAQLASAVGAARAADLIASTRPANFDDPVDAGVDRASLSPRAAFVVFPVVASKAAAWATAATASALPDRFVFIGYHGSDAPLVALGAPVPSTLPVSPDPGAPEGEGLHLDANGNLVVPDALSWMSDFDRAVARGMGLRIPLTQAQAAQGFDRVLVVGLRLASDAAAGQHELETLLSHHADGSWLGKRDGQWVAEYLGVDPAVFAHVHGAGTQDQRAARAMSTALWPATLGYWMQTMMAPVFDAATIDATREFFRKYVQGSGAVPALRIGAQPYGILPATAWSRMRWFEADTAAAGAPALHPLRAYLRKLYPLVLAVDRDWRTRFTDLAYVGEPGDPQAALLDVLGLHPGSVEWSQRYAESLATVFNRLQLQGLAGFFEAIALAAEFKDAGDLLHGLGYTGSTTPKAVQLLFAGTDNLLTGGVADDRPLSESAPVRAYCADGRNYLQWVADAARTSLDALYQQDGFIGDAPPSALLYLLLRHALQLGYHDAAVGLYQTAGLYTADAAALARSDDPFINIRQGAQASESRYQPLYATAPAITGSATQTVGDFIAGELAAPTFAYGLADQIAAVDVLADQPTARLERVFADHVDCCTYRLDAWYLGIASCQLAAMRNLQDGQTDAARQGVFLGAYGWLEDVRPAQAAAVPVTLDDPDLAATFATGAPLLHDPDNEGFVHAPSLNHAVAAAMLRNGYVTDASPQNQQTLAVNLTSERVRVALGLLDGIRAGQGLPDLLGYQFERGLHDRYAMAEVDSFIFKLRKAFPLRGDRMQSTHTDDGVPIEAIEARNVIDGLALVRHMKDSGNAHYPFGKSDLPPATAEQAAAIDAEADRLLETHDAVADLALSEGVYQAALGNYDRVAANLDSYARGQFPPEPGIARTPVHGIGLTHRVALHLDPAASHDVSPVNGIAMTPRARAEPALNRWLTDLLPPLSSVGCMVTFRAADGSAAEREVTLDALALQPADVLALFNDDTTATPELDARIVASAAAHFDARPDGTIEIRYMGKQHAAFSVFEMAPLVRMLRQATSRARPLRASDLKLTNEASAQHDATPAFDATRIAAVRNDLATLRDDLAAFAAQLAAPLGDLAHRRAEILAHVDDYVATLVGLFARSAMFAIGQAGWTFAQGFRQDLQVAVRAQFAKLAARWADRLVQCNSLLTAEAALPGTADPQARIDLLTRAEAQVAAAPAIPVPALSSLRNHVIARRDAYAVKRLALARIPDSPRTGIAALLTDASALLPLTEFDTAPFDLAVREDAVVRFAGDALDAVNGVVAECERRLSDAQVNLDRSAAAAAANDQVAALQDAAQSLLGSGFVILPSYALPAADAAEVGNALAASQSGDLFAHLTHPADLTQPPLDFPVDTWLYGVARVRENIRAWEQAVMLAGSLGRAEPELAAIQLPYAANDRWLALEFPPDLALDHERLLYTAHLAAPFDSGARLCGLLLDEWTETIPTAAVDTGIAFHHDRPDCEAPQCMLLVTPSEFRGAWQWNDVVDALNETLDLAKRRVVEPAHIDATPYAPFLPATAMATQVRQLTIAADLSLNNAAVLAP
jgi:hypothetical protein